MSLSKALRFEVLRRDGFACTYCGRKPPDVELHIDHVIPDALGGRDTPENLRTACVDCNAGKGSTPPDASLVAQVADDAARWAAAIQQAGAEMVDEKLSTQWFIDLWVSISVLDDAIEHLPVDAQERVARLIKNGLPRQIVEDMVWVTATARNVQGRHRFAYFIGCCNRRVEQLQERARQLVDVETDPET